MNHQRIAELRKLSTAVAGGLGALMAPAPVSVIETPLVKAAQELLHDKGDRSAALMQLAAMFPDKTVAELDRTLREVAAMLHCAGVCQTEGC